MDSKPICNVDEWLTFVTAAYLLCICYERRVNWFTSASPVLDLEDVHIYEYAVEFGFLRMSPKTRQKLNITTTFVVLGEFLWLFKIISLNRLNGWTSLDIFHCRFQPAASQAYSCQTSSPNTCKIQERGWCQLFTVRRKQCNAPARLSNRSFSYVMWDEVYWGFNIVVWIQSAKILHFQAFCSTHFYIYWTVSNIKSVCVSHASQGLQFSPSMIAVGLLAMLKT